MSQSSVASGGGEWWDGGNFIHFKVESGVLKGFYEFRECSTSTTW
jgi:hypothetical protein